MKKSFNDRIIPVGWKKDFWQKVEYSFKDKIVQNKLKVELDFGQKKMGVWQKVKKSFTDKIMQNEWTVG